MRLNIFGLVVGVMLAALLVAWGIVGAQEAGGNTRLELHLSARDIWHAAR